MRTSTYRRLKKENPKLLKLKNSIAWEKRWDKIKNNPVLFSKWKEKRRVWKEKRRIMIKQRRLRLRFKILKRDNFTCQYCGRKSPEVILEIDHKYPKSRGGLNKITNYQTLCKDCNLGKGDSILEEFKG